MKKEYQKPLAEIIEFVPNENIMNDIDVGDDLEVGSSVEDW